ncbi:MAG TPA: hypothetical protein VJI70_02455 [Candidatus Paceibacterota bacterium]
MEILIAREFANKNTRDAAFYFANLGADVSRCITASKQGDMARYEDSLSRAYRTLEDLHKKVS